MPMLDKPNFKYPAFAPIALADRTWPDRVLDRAPLWCSVDLRDGNQALIEPMDLERKYTFFQQLVSIGFRQIEVGFPSASQAEFDFVRRLIEHELIPEGVTIQVLTPARAELIETTFEALRGAPRAIVHLYNATSPAMRQVVLGLDENGTVELAVTHARMIRDLASRHSETEWTLQYSPEMFSGTELAFSKRIVDAVTEVWQPTSNHKCIINLPSTVELCTPNVFADMIEWMHRHLDRRDALVLSVHPHNDRGTGTAAGELALMAGADRVEGCLFGNGERTGNVDLVNLALNLYTQGVHPGLDFSNIDEIRRCVEHCNQLPTSPRHPYAGDLVYTSFSGSHQDAISKAFVAQRPGQPWSIPYLPIDPRDLGRGYDAVIRVNSQSGKGGIAYLLKQGHGLELPRRLQIEFATLVQRILDVQGQELNAQDVWRLLSCEYSLSAEALCLDALRVVDFQDGHVGVTATVWRGSDAVHLCGRGTEVLTAIVNALVRATGYDIAIVDVKEHAMVAGTGSQTAAFVDLRVAHTRSLYGIGIDTDAARATLKAVISSLIRHGVSLHARSVTA